MRNGGECLDLHSKPRSPRFVVKKSCFSFRIARKHNGKERISNCDGTLAFAESPCGRGRRTASNRQRTLYRLPIRDTDPG